MFSGGRPPVSGDDPAAVSCGAAVGGGGRTAPWSVSHLRMRGQVVTAQMSSSGYSAASSAMRAWRRAVFWVFIVHPSRSV